MRVYEEAEERGGGGGAQRQAVNGLACHSQGWLFHSGFWGPAEVKAYLSGVSNSDMMILDLNTDEDALWAKYDGYYGKPWVWCMLHNYGGRRGLYGDIPEMASQPLKDKATAGSGMAGIGITMEAIEQNPVMYELMLEMGWRSDPFDVPTWLHDYAFSRYGNASASAYAAWDQLLGGVYSQNGIDVSIVELAPSVGLDSSTNTNATAVTVAWRLLQQAADNVRKEREREGEEGDSS